MNRNILLISNSGVLLDNKDGNKIDLFDGEIGRFNDFLLKGYSEYVGTRCDWWLGNNTFFGQRGYKEPKRIFLGYYNPKARILTRTRSEFIGGAVINKIRDITGLKAPGGGILGIFYFLCKGYKVFIHGFDCCRDGRMHYWENEKVNEVAFIKRNKWHNRDAEKLWLDDALNVGMINKL